MTTLAHRSADLRKPTEAALDLLGGAVSPRLYEITKDTLVFQCGLWLTEHGITLEDIKAACLMCSAPAVLATIRFDTDLTAAFAGCVERAKLARWQREEQERNRIEARREAEPTNPNERAIVSALLSGVTSRVRRRTRGTDG